MIKMKRPKAKVSNILAQIRDRWQNGLSLEEKEKCNDSARYILE